MDDLDPPNWVQSYTCAAGNRFGWIIFTPYGFPGVALILDVLCVLSNQMKRKEGGE